MWGSTLLPRGETWSTTSTAAGRSAGSPATTAEMASTPPADPPTAITATPRSSALRPMYVFPRSFDITLVLARRAQNRAQAGSDSTLVTVSHARARVSMTAAGSPVRVASTRAGGLALMNTVPRSARSWAWVMSRASPVRRPLSQQAHTEPPTRRAQLHRAFVQGLDQHVVVALPGCQRADHVRLELDRHGAPAQAEVAHPEVVLGEPYVAAGLVEVLGAVC